ncbi:SDR family oxidoreductase [Lacticigenium naphthae]|uniref:SDR family oxidoreductase n=1 Tax=Lacticigenium naphthae TaxID=515351 RepID=UPI0004159252|nr:SDR family oxidoreductase [Lacticigenium naphthae]
MFEETVTVITGGANGIGQALVKGFAAQKSAVAFIDQDQAAGEKLKHELEAEGKTVYFHQGDISRPEVLKKFVEKIVERFGKVSFVLNNTMKSNHGILSDCSYEEFVESFKIGVAAPYELTRLVLPYLDQDAVIVNISSSRAYQSQQDTESYSAAKGGITALSHSLMMSLKGKARVNAIFPGWIDTGETYDKDYKPDYTRADSGQHPSERVGKPEDIVEAAFFLCDPKNSFVNGAELFVDGGMSKQMIYADDEGWSYQQQER